MNEKPGHLLIEKSNVNSSPSSSSKTCRPLKVIYSDTAYIGNDLTANGQKESKTTVNLCEQPQKRYSNGAHNSSNSHTQRPAVSTISSSHSSVAGHHHHHHLHHHSPQLQTSVNNNNSFSSSASSSAASPPAPLNSSNISNSSSSHTSSNSNSGGGGVNSTPARHANSNGYSELLRYRSQEFYTKVHYPNGSANSTNSTSSNGSCNGKQESPSSLLSQPSQTDQAYSNALSSPSSSSASTSHAHQQQQPPLQQSHSNGTSPSLAYHRNHHSHHHHNPNLQHHHSTNHLAAKELSLNDLSHPSLYNSIDQHSTTSSGAPTSSATAAQILQSRLAAANQQQRYYPHHPHYSNHLYSAGALSGALSGSSSLVRSNSSLSLSYHQYQKKYSKLLNGNYHHHQPHQPHHPLVPSHQILSQVSANPSVTLSTHNLFSDSGYCSAYSGSIASGTLDSRHSKISTESSNSFLSYSQQLAQHHQVQQQLQHQLNSFEQQQNALAFGGGVSSVKQPQQQQFTSVEPSPSPNSSTSNYYSSSLSLSAPPASASSSKTAGTHSSPGRQRLPGAPNLMVSTTRSPSHSAGTSAAQNVRPYLGSAMSASSSSTTTTTSTTTGRATLTRSSSSGPAVVGGDASLSVAPNHHYGQILNSSVVGGSAYALNTAASSRPASLVTVLADGNVQQQQQATYASPSHHNHQQQHHQHHLQQQQYGTSQQFGGQGSNVVHGNYHHLYGSTTGAKAQSTAVAGAYHKVASNGIVPSVSSSSNNNYGLPQRFPTTITQTKSPSMVKLVSTTTAGTGTAAAALAAPPPSIMSSSYHSHYSTGMGPNSGQAATSSAAPQNSSSTGNSSVSSSTSMAVGSGNQSSFPRSLFNTSSNIFESKKNKLFGSVSSIDLQCLKESQKVSVIERKSSRIGRSLKSTSNSSNTSTTTIAPTTISTTVASATSASSNGSSGSTTSSFFRLFTSGSSKKMIPFSFSGSGSASSGHQQQQQLSPPTPGSAVPSASVNHYSGSGSASSASSSSSTHTITARSGSDGVVLNGDQQQQQQQHGRRTITQQSEPINGKPIKSNSLDSAANTVTSVSGITSLSLSTANMTVSAVSSSVSAQQLTNTILELTLPANEVLFRRYFTFFDLMSSLNHQRLFEASPPPSSSTSSSTSSGFSSGTINSTGSSATSSSSIIQQESYQSHQQRITNNGQSVCVVTTFESSTLSSTSSYSSCTSSLSSASHPTQQYSSSQYGYNKSAMSTSVTSATSNGNHMASSSCNNSVTAAAAAVVVPSDVGNDLLSPSLNFLNEIGSERQYSIELKWNNGSKEEIPAEMLDEKKHNADRSIYDTVNSALNGSQGVNSGDSKSTSASTATANSTSQLHPPLLARCLNIFSDASPFTNPGHSVMSDLFGAGSLTVGSGASKSIVTDFGSDDGFVSLSSTSHHGCGSTYPNGGGGNGCASPTENSRCPFSTAAEKCNVVEVDYGTNYYRTHFRDSEHQNWLQMHEKYGPIVVSLRKERVKSSSGNGATSSGSSSSSSSSSSASSTRWRVIVRTTSLIPLRGTIAALPSICLPGGSPGSCSLDSSGGSSSSRSKGSANQADQFNINSVKDVLSLVMPKSVCVSNFRLGSPTAVSFLLKLDELSQNTEYKIGVLYAYAAQHSEEEFYNNILDYSTASKGNQFYDFLGLISSRVRLKDYKGYKAGLDVLNDTTGEYSWTARHHSVDIMFHVCTELPFTETNRQQLPRKRHIGNDIVTIVFLKEDFHGPAFSPALIRSKFQQVFIIVKPVNNGQYYRVAVARHRLVPLFGPPLKPCYTRHELKDFILTKIINAENACHSVNKFAEMAKRTRNEYLVDLCSKHTTNQTVHHVDSSSSSMNSLNSFKKLFGSSSSSNSTSGGGSGSGGDQYHHVSSSKRSKHLSANHEFHLVNQDAYLTGGALAPLTGPPFSRSHILNGVKDPPTLLGGIVFNERCAGSSVPSRLYVHDFSTSRDIEASLLLSNEAILVIDAASSEVIWAAPVTSIIGWTDSSGVFATSPTTSPVIEHHSEKMVNGSSGSGSGHANHRLGALRAKSMDCEPSSASSSAMHSSATTCRIFRLYYHHGECIEIKQRPTGAPALPAILEPSPSTTAKSARNQAIAASTAHHPSRSDDPFLHLIRILELITRKSELREIVIKRKTSPVHKSSNQTPNGQATTASLDLLGRCGGQFGFSMSLSSGIIEEVMDQTLSAYRLSPGCKVVEIAKISFAAMAPEELQELLSASVIICLTFTEFDFARYQPRCSCPSPQALQMQRQKCLMQTPPSEYENLPLAPKIMPSSSSSNYLGPVKSNGTTINVQPGVKTIHITHNANHSNTSTVTLPQSGEQPQQPQQQPQSHQTLMNMSSTSSTSSTYYSPSNSQTQSPSQHYGTYQSTTSSGGGGGQSSSSSLYQAKSASNLSQYNHGVYHGTATSSPHHHQQKQHHQQQSSPTKSIISSGAAMSATSSPANSASVVRSRSSTINNGSATFKDNLIRLITMDDCGLSSPTGSSHSPGHKSTDESVLTVADGHIIVDPSPSTSSTDPHQQHFQSSQTISQLVSNYQHPHYYGTGRAGNALPGHVQVTTSANSAYAAGSNNNNNNNNSSHIDPYSPYPSSRYSTASSTQYSSLGRSGAIGHLTSTQIQVPQQPSSAAGAPSNALVQQGSTIRASAGGGGVVVENNDCYLLTAQPVRVDSTCSSSTTSSATLATSSNSSRTHHDLQQQHHNHNHNNNMMTGSLDSTSAGSLLGSSISSNTCNSTASSSAAMFNSLLSSSSATSASETIAGIVWPSMHQLGPSDVGGASNVGAGVSSLTGSTLEMTDSPPSSLMIHTPLNRAALVGNEIVVTGNEQINGQQKATVVTGPVAEVHLTDEVRKLSLEKDALNDTIVRLREENQRLHQESQNTSQQLRKLTEWFFNTGSSGSASSSSNASANGTPTGGPNTTTIAIQQQHQQQQPPFSNGPNNV